MHENDNRWREQLNQEMSLKVDAESMIEGLEDKIRQMMSSKMISG